MKLPDGWDSELQLVELFECDAKLENGRLGDEMRKKIAPLEQRIKRIERSYEERMQDTSIYNQQREDEWIRIREQYPVEHPTPIEKFETYRDAAEVLAHYWVGETVSEDRLVRSIMDDHRVNLRACEYATNLTKPGSPEREYVEMAQQFLWEDAGR